MRKYLLAATAVAVLSAPAFAAANGPYVGIEGGVTFPQSTDLDVILNNTSDTDDHDDLQQRLQPRLQEAGWNVDAIAGYKLGLFKLEVEAGYQRAKVEEPQRQLDAARRRRDGGGRHGDGRRPRGRQQDGRQIC